MQLLGEGADKVEPAAEELHVASRDRRGDHVGAELDPVGHHRVRRAFEPLHPLDGDRRRALALDLRAHAAQAPREVDDLGLPRRGLDHRGAPRQRRRHQRVLRRPHRHEGKRDAAAAEPARRRGMDVALAQVDRRAERLKRAQVQVDRPRPDRAAARQRHDRLPGPRQQRAEHEDGGAHLADDVVIGLVACQVVRGERQHLPALQRRHLAAERLQQLGHGADVAEARRVCEGQRLVRKQRCRHQRKAGVLGAGDRDAALELAPAPHQDRIHASAFSVGASRLGLRLPTGKIGLERGLQAKRAGVGLRRLWLGAPALGSVRCHAGSLPQGPERVQCTAAAAMRRPPPGVRSRR